MPTPPDPPRARDLKRIHAAAREMAWTDETYRAILERVTGQRSAAALTARQRQRVLTEFARLGWKPQKSKTHRAPNPPAPAHCAPLSPRGRGAGGEGAAPPSPAGGRGVGGEGAIPLTGPGWGKDRLLAKIGALLAEAGRGWTYADGIARHMFGLESLRFCDPEQLRKVVSALEYDKKRRAKRAARAPIDAA